MSAPRRLLPLRPEQAEAADPLTNAWTSASAGTGKTQVLTARVLRLLLAGASPERIVALTFTKAAAAEMQSRIFEQLAAWVMADDQALDADLAAIGAPAGPVSRELARQLFARTLDARGGLRISTLHAFAQSLLASFPIEAGIAPGFSALDERSALTLRARVLAEEIEAATAAGDSGFLDDIKALAVSGGEARLSQVAGVMIGDADAIAALGDPQGFEARLRRWLAVPQAGSAEEVLAAALASVDEVGLLRFARALAADKGTTAQQRADAMKCWIGYQPAARVANFDVLARTMTTAGGTRLARLVPAGVERDDPALVPLATRLADQIDALLDLRARLQTAALAARYLRVGARLAAAYGAHKRRGGFIDYGDMIARARDVLAQPDMGQWVRYKLDQQIDHLLVDEAQDTNIAQWEIVRALTEEFHDGEGARALVRTLFVVGDFKQAIMSFQGSDPYVFRDQMEVFQQRIDDAGAAWCAAQLSVSFRSVPVVLAAVDAVLDTLGYPALGMREPVPPHVAHRTGLAGSVTLWPPIAPDADVPDDAADMGWIADAKRRMAHNIARQIAAWLDPATALELPARGRVARAQDILVLVRARDEMLSPLVSALHDARVPVAGVDRLRLTAPIAVQDLMSLVRFVLQPRDDLSTAEVLTSPLLGWSQEQLFALAAGRGAASLWDRLRQGDDAHIRTAHDWLGEALRLADYCAPYEFLETVLSGPLGGRARLLARLGEEARDPIGEVLKQALAFETEHAPSLQGFLAWIEQDDSDLKRDPEGARDAVRIMTVHGAKGLQAPIVILADATRAPAGDRSGHVRINPDDNESPVPIFYGGKAGRLGQIGDEVDANELAQLEEHWRLLYVAMTRAEDMLFIGGALPTPRGAKPAELPENSWYGAIEDGLAAHFGDKLMTEDDAIWGSRQVLHGAGTRVVPDGGSAPEAVADVALPDWLQRPAPPEARPPVPLSPSKLAEDDIAMPPPGAAQARAAARGKLLHALFERLPAVPPPARAGAAADWLARNAADFDADARAAIAAEVLAVIEAPAHAALFGPEALAEAPIAARVGDMVIAGKVDRLLVRDDAVLIVDFKTGSRIPADAAAVERYHLRQMAAYAAALARIFPDRPVRAALLYTAAAKIIELPPALLAQHAPGS